MRLIRLFNPLWANTMSQWAADLKYINTHNICYALWASVPPFIPPLDHRLMFPCLIIDHWGWQTVCFWLILHDKMSDIQQQQMSKDYFSYLKCNAGYISSHWHKIISNSNKAHKAVRLTDWPHGPRCAAPPGHQQVTGASCCISFGSLLLFGEKGVRCSFRNEGNLN